MLLRSTHVSAQFGGDHTTGTYSIDDLVRIAVIAPGTDDQIYGMLNDDNRNFSSRFIQNETKMILK